MSTWLPHLARPGWLLLLPLGAWLLWRLWHRQRRVGQWQRLIPARFHALLLRGDRPRDERAPLALLGLAWLLATLALLGPSWQADTPVAPQAGDPLVVVLEVTPAMLAADAPPDRLELARRKLLDLLAARDGAYTGVVVYAGSAHTLVPLSNDRATTVNLLQAVRPGIMPEPGNRADLAIAQAHRLLEQAGLGAGRVLLIASALDERERQGIATLLARQPLTLRMLGVGSAEGAPVQREDGSLLRNAEGAILLPRLDANGLSRFIAEVGGRYRTAGPENDDLAALGLLRGNATGATTDDARTRVTWRDQGHWLLLPLLLVAACAARRGWLLCLAPLAFWPQPSLAFEWRDLWLRPDQQGLRLLQADQPEQAAQRFADSQWRGFAAYQAGDYAAAAAEFAREDSAVAHFNRGNALARDHRLDAALEAYEQALERDPQLEPARHNRALVEQWLREREAAEQPQQEQAATRPSSPSPATGGVSSMPAQAPTEHAADGRPAEGDETGQGSADGTPSGALSESDQERQQWLRRIPDDPGELLRQKFLLEYRQRQETAP